MREREGDQRIVASSAHVCVFTPPPPWPVYVYTYACIYMRRTANRERGKRAGGSSSNVAFLFCFSRTRDSDGLFSSASPRCAGLVTRGIPVRYGFYEFHGGFFGRALNFGRGVWRDFCVALFCCLFGALNWRG